MTISSLPVNARAARTAIITASVAELVKRTRSMDGRARAESLGELPLQGGRRGQRRRAARALAVRVIASTMRGCACPCTSGV